MRKVNLLHRYQFSGYLMLSYVIVYWILFATSYRKLPAQFSIGNIYASVNSSCAHPPGANPRGIFLLFSYGWQIPGDGDGVT